METWRDQREIIMLIIMLLRCEMNINYAIN